MTPILISGGISIDDRGVISFYNNFDFSLFRGVGVKRFYLVSNHRQGLIRAWHAHKHEAKAITVVEGAAIVAAVQINDWGHPDPLAEVHRYVLSTTKPSILFVPAGYANGFCTLTADARLLIFSSATVEESQRDDYRYDPHYWSDPWRVIER